jgi:hypothetical protein
MEKRERFIAELREAARARGLAFRVTPGRGKGTTLPSRDIDPKTARKILKALGLD